MSICRDYDELIWAAAEAGNMREGLNEHLLVCERCRILYERLVEAFSDFEAMKSVAAPNPKIVVRDAPSRRLRLAMVFAGAVAFALVLGALVLSGRHSSPAPSKPRTKVMSNKPNGATGKTLVGRKQPSRVATAPEVAAKGVVQRSAVKPKFHRPNKKDVVVLSVHDGRTAVIHLIAAKRVEVYASHPVSPPDGSVDVARETTIVRLGSVIVLRLRESKVITLPPPSMDAEPIERPPIQVVSTPRDKERLPDL